jgi:predicted DNA-binding ArsR family transcriptional regulator
MVDLVKLRKDLTDPLLRYHKRDGDDWGDVASAEFDAIKLARELLAKPNIMKFMDSLSGLSTDTSKLSDAIITKWKTDPQFLNKLEGDLGKDPAAATRLIDAIKKDPNKVATSINAMSQYNVGALATLAPLVVTPAAAVAPATASPKPGAGGSAAAPAKPVPAQAQNRPAPQVAPVATTTVRPADAGVPAPAAPQPAAAAVPDAPAPTVPVATASSTPPSAEDLAKGQKFARDVFESLADAPDAEIAQVLTKDMVKTILTSMSQDAIAKFGVEAGVADAFKKRIENDSELLNNITTNFRNNPEFIRQLAKASKDSGEPISEAKKNAARAMMTPIMENPQNLAEDSYVKEMTGKLKLGNSKSPLMDMFAGMFGGLGGWLGQLMEGFKRFFSGFFGDKKVFSVVSQGGSMLPSLMVNPRAIEENRLKYDTEAGVSARSMTALSLDGKRFITVKEKGPDGKEIEKQVPNTIEITTIDGKKVKVVPAVGVLLAQQAKGDYDPDTGRWVAGPVNAWVVTGLNEAGGSSAVKRVTMSETEFLKFKKRVDEISVKDGDGRQLAFQNYTEQDARKAGIVPRIQVASVNPQTGAVTDTVLRPTAQPASPAPAGPQSYPVRPGGTDAANDPELALKA